MNVQSVDQFKSKYDTFQKDRWNDEHKVHEGNDILKNPDPEIIPKLKQKVIELKNKNY